MNMLTAALVIAASTPAAPHEMSGWNADYGVALQATRDTQKPLLVLIDQPEDPASGSDEAVLHSDDELLAETLDEYTLCYVDASTAYGQRVADVFKVREYPFAAIIDSQGQKIVEKWTGSREGWQWAAALGATSPPSGARYSGPATTRSSSRSGNGRSASRVCYT